MHKSRMYAICIYVVLVCCTYVLYMRVLQVVLAGDPMQLGPVIQSSSAKACGAEESLLERLSRRTPFARDTKAFADHGNYDPMLVTKLIRNYRSHNAIIQVRRTSAYTSILVLVVRCGVFMVFAYEFVS